MSSKCLSAGAKEVFVSPHDLSKADECVAAVKETVDKFGGELVVLWIDSLNCRRPN